MSGILIPLRKLPGLDAESEGSDGNDEGRLVDFSRVLGNSRIHRSIEPDSPIICGTCLRKIL